MKFLTLLGKQLKDDSVVEILDHHNITVTYQFDRSHENLPDMYWADSKEMGFQFRFSPAQILDVIFLYIVRRDGFSPLSLSDCDVPFFPNLVEAEKYGREKGLPTRTGGPVELLGISSGEWIRFEFPSHSLHYEFQGKVLALVTIALINGRKPL